MKQKAVVEVGKQGRESVAAFSAMMQQLVLPLVVGVEATRKGLLSFVHQMGMAALQQLLEQEAVAVAGPKGKHRVGRTYNRWGTAKTRLPFGGRNASVEYPRIRKKGGGEVALPVMEEFRASDPIPARVAEQIVLGVSTRGYERSLEPVPEDMVVSGASKSSASRALIDNTAKQLDAFLLRRLEGYDIIAMFIDAIEFARKSVVVCLGVTGDGTKVPLGISLGSTENATVATALLTGLIERGLAVNGKILFVIDGGKGIRKAIDDVFGTAAVIQRCQIHKMRNVRDYIPEARHAYVMRHMRQAYAGSNSKLARKQLVQLASWLEANGESSAAASLREGMAETLTVLDFKLPEALRRTFASTNAVENLNGTLRRVCRNVKRWVGEAMIQRWVALGLAEAERKFRRVNGYKFMPSLLSALRPADASIANKSRVA